jgi:hypothetical protein
MSSTINHKSLANLVLKRNLSYRRNDVPANSQFDKLLEDTFEIVINCSYGGYGLRNKVRAIMVRRIEERGYEAFALDYGFDLSKVKLEPTVYPDDDSEEIQEDDTDYTCSSVYPKEGENPTLTFLIKSSFYRTSPFFISCVRELEEEKSSWYNESYYKDDHSTYGICKIPMYLAECAQISEYDGAESIKYEAGRYYANAIPNLTPETVDDLKLFQQVFDYYIARR